MDPVKVGVAGATGYLGAELLRILAAHPNVDLAVLASSSKAGKRVAEELPQFRAVLDHTLVPLSASAFAECDFVFLATPTGIARSLAPSLLAQGNRVIDLSGDHRLRDPALSKKHYGEAAPALAQAVYGLPEANRKAIKSAKLVANPGCYPTASALALLPLLAMGEVEPRVIVDAKSGVSGAGREPSDEFHFPEMNEGMHAYKVGSHRHGPEIAQTLATAFGADVNVTFTPHVVPLNRGILATAYAFPAEGESLDAEELTAFYEKFYADAPFVRVVPDEPDVHDVRGTNFCDMRPHAAAGGVVVVTSAIDNLTKGGSGQAVQNLNLMAGFPETLGLPVLSGGV